jgi:hypothetical protein
MGNSRKLRKFSSQRRGECELFTAEARRRGEQQKLGREFTRKDANGSKLEFRMGFLENPIRFDLTGLKIFL